MAAVGVAKGPPRPGNRLGRSCFLAWLAIAQPCAGQNLVIVTLDGLGHEIVTRDPVAAELTVLNDTIRAGVFAAGVQPPRPALTAVSHASIWTGAWPEVNGVTFNHMPALPRTANKASETVIGFLGTRLLAEPFWVSAGRQGVESLAFQPTQGFPFTPVNTGMGATVINSYQTRVYASYAVYGPKDVDWVAGGSFTFRHGTRVYRATPARGGLAIGTESGECVLAPAEPVEAAPPYQRELARHFRPLPLDGGESGVFFRLFGYDGAAKRLRLLVSAAHETGWHGGGSRRHAEARAMVQQCGPAAINGASALLNSGSITAAEYLETVELVIRQLTRHAAWACARVAPRLMQGYLPFPDEFDHKWIALARAGEGDYAAYRRWGYIAVNRGMAAYAELARGGGWLLWASDHGMAEVGKSVSIAEVLARAGLDDNVRLLHNSMLVNTDDWAEGVIPERRKPHLVARIRDELRKLRDPQDGQLVVREILTAGDGIAVCPACADLHYELAPGFRTDGRRGPAVIGRLTPPEGAHGFGPGRADMLAVFAACGPGIPAGSAITGMRTIDIAAMISGLLGIEPPRQSQGRRPRVEVRSSP